MIQWEWGAMICLFRLEMGDDWSTPQHLGPEVNTENLEYGAEVSRDGRLPLLHIAWSRKKRTFFRF